MAYLPHIKRMLTCVIHNTISRVTDAFTGGASITPSDSTDLTTPIRGIIVGVSGNVKVDLQDGSAVTFYAYAGTVYHMIVTRVYSTGTAATGIVGFY